MDYAIDNLTNRYDSVGGNTLTYDAAGNLTTDKDAYHYEYDYENRITKIIKSGPTTVAEFAYDALGMRIEKKDSITSANTRRYYYNTNWQTLSEYDTGDVHKKSYVYGNYIDEVLMMPSSASFLNRYYLHDHLYSPVALTDYNGVTIERYEYDAYGNCYIMDASYNPRSSSLYGNPYYFTGRETDSFESGSLKIMNYRHRTYDTYTGRFTTHDPMGYLDGMNLYEYVMSNPVSTLDLLGLLTNEDAKRIVLQYLNSKESLPVEGLDDPATDQQCVDFHLNMLRKSEAITTLKKIAVGVGLTPIEVVLPGKAKIPAKAIKDIFDKLAEGPVSKRDIVEMLKKYMHDVPTDVIENIAKKLLGTDIGATFGKTLLVERKVRFPEKAEVICHFLVTGETRRDWIGKELYEKGHRFVLFASCKYECLATTPEKCPCCCRGVFSLIAWGEHGEQRYMAKKYPKEEILLFTRMKK